MSGTDSESSKEAKVADMSTSDIEAQLGTVADTALGVVSPKATHEADNPMTEQSTSSCDDDHPAPLQGDSTPLAHDVQPNVEAEVATGDTDNTISLLPPAHIQDPTVAHAITTTSVLGGASDADLQVICRLMLGMEITKLASMERTAMIHAIADHVCHYHSMVEQSRKSLFPSQLLLSKDRKSGPVSGSIRTLPLAPPVKSHEPASTAAAAATAKKTTAGTSSAPKRKPTQPADDTGDKKKRTKKAKDPFRPATVNGYLVYRRSREADLKAEQPDITAQERTKVMSQEWNSMDAESKAPFVEQSAAECEEKNKLKAQQKAEFEQKERDEADADEGDQGGATESDEEDPPKKRREAVVNEKKKRTKSAQKLSTVDDDEEEQQDVQNDYQQDEADEDIPAVSARKKRRLHRKAVESSDDEAEYDPVATSTPDTKEVSTSKPSSSQPTTKAPTLASRLNAAIARFLDPCNGDFSKLKKRHLLNAVTSELGAAAMDSLTTQMMWDLTNAYINMHDPTLKVNK
jgi:hypothetical protein